MNLFSCETSLFTLWDTKFELLTKEIYDRILRYFYWLFFRIVIIILCYEYFIP